MTPLVNAETNRSVTAFIDSIEHETRREDSKELLKMLKKITGKKPKVWGDNNFIAFGKYTYKRKGQKEEYEWFNVGFAPRKNNITIYVTYDISAEKKLLAQLGPHKCGRGCLYIKRLSDVDRTALTKILTKSKDSGWGY